MKCKICGGTVWSGVVLHRECFDKIKWHATDERPHLYMKLYNIDEQLVPCMVSDELLCQLDSGNYKICRFDGDTIQWFCDDGTMPRVVRWRYIR